MSNSGKASTRSLYTDLENPISNSIYGKIGYRRVCDPADLRFV